MLPLLMLLVALVTCPNTVQAWGAVGHAIAANIAQTMLTSKALEMSSMLLNQSELSLAGVASWADTVSSQQKYLFTKPLHYVNQPPQTVIDQCHYEVLRDCPVSEGCVDSAVHNYTARTINQNMNLTWADRNEAFKFAIHFIEDLHQPLHAGFNNDRGGNNVQGTFNGSKTNLHSLWDSGLINYGIKTMYNNNQSLWTDHLLDVLAQTSRDTIDEWLKCPESDVVDGTFIPCSGKWVNESALLVCEYSYQSDNHTFMTVDTGFKLNQTYFDRNWNVLESQLIKAAVRLAYSINKAADIHYSPDNNHDDDDSSMWIIIAAIAAVSLFILVICCGAWIKKRMRTAPKDTLLQNGTEASNLHYSSI